MEVTGLQRRTEGGSREPGAIFTRAQNFQKTIYSKSDEFLHLPSVTKLLVLVMTAKVELNTNLYLVVQGLQKSFTLEEK